MKRILAGAIAAGLVGSAGSLGYGVASAEENAVVVGGARAPGIPYTAYTNASGRYYYPGANRANIDYPGGLAQGRLPDLIWPGTPLSTPTVGESVVIGDNNLTTAIQDRAGAPVPTVAIGLSEGSLVLDATQERLAHDPAAPPPDQLSFAMFGDPAGRHAFGQSLLTTMFPTGTFVPMIDYVIPPVVDSQYDTTRVIAAYDGISDFPDRPENLISVANSIMGAAIVHTPVAFTHPSDVPPQNIRTTTNSRGATTTTYLVPNKYLPLTMPLRNLGLPPEQIDQLDRALQPMVDAGYSRNDNPAIAPRTVDPAVEDPIVVLESVAPLDDIKPQDVVRDVTGINIDIPDVGGLTNVNLDGVLNQAGGLLPPGIL